MTWESAEQRLSKESGKSSCVKIRTEKKNRAQAEIHRQWCVYSAHPGLVLVLPGGSVVWEPGAADQGELCGLELGSGTQGAHTGFWGEDHHDHL